jgi:hypothetical protein
MFVSDDHWYLLIVTASWERFCDVLHVTKQMNETSHSLLSKIKSAPS